MPTAVLAIFYGNARRHAAFFAFVVASALVFWKTLGTLVVYSLHDNSSSHIMLIPSVAFSLLYMERKRVFSITRTSISSSLARVLVVGEVGQPAKDCGSSCGSSSRAIELS